MSEAARPLSPEEIERLGVQAGMHINSLPEDFNGARQPEVIERIVMDLGFEVIGMTNQQPSVPEEVDFNDSF